MSHQPADHRESPIDQGLESIVKQVQELQELVQGAGVWRQGDEARYAPETADDFDCESRLDEGDRELVRAFMADALGHLSAAQDALDRLADVPVDAPSLGRLYSAFHSIKGAAGFLRLRQINALCHAVEEAIEHRRTSMDVDLVGLLHKAAEMMHGLLDSLGQAIARGGIIQPHPPLARFLFSLRIVCDQADAQSATRH